MGRNIPGWLASATLTYLPSSTNTHDLDAFSIPLLEVAADDIGHRAKDRVANTRSASCGPRTSARIATRRRSKTPAPSKPSAHHGSAPLSVGAQTVRRQEPSRVPGQVVAVRRGGPRARGTRGRTNCHARSGLEDRRYLRLRMSRALEAPTPGTVGTDGRRFRDRGPPGICRGREIEHQGERQRQEAGSDEAACGRCMRRPRPITS
jgi:hypothetical protein